MSEMNKTQLLIEGGKVRAFYRRKVHVLFLNEEPQWEIKWEDWLKSYKDQVGFSLRTMWVLRETRLG